MALLKIVAYDANCLTAPNQYKIAAYYTKYLPFLNNCILKILIDSAVTLSRL